MTLLHDWFAWPDGSVLTNLIASAIWFIPGFFVGLRHAKKIHSKLDRLHQHLGIPEEGET
jgi:hypothetical protein